MRPHPGGSLPAARRQPGGKDNLAPAEDLHNKNPSLLALGKNGWILRPQENSKTLESRIAVFLKPFGGFWSGTLGPLRLPGGPSWPLGPGTLAFLRPKAHGLRPRPKNLDFP